MDAPKKKMSVPVMIALFGPFILFVVLVVIMFSHMETTNPDTANLVPNALAGKPAPATVLPLLGQTGSFNPDDFKGRVTLVNFWGSWCPPCRDEHPTLIEISKDKRFDLVGINYKDREENAIRFLDNFRSPFKLVGFDPSGRAAIDWGVYGPPETFLLNREGIIIYKHIGPLTPQIYKDETLPQIEKALNSNTNTSSADNSSSR
ncbi:DsbE family thiol:disulfide interchange protein [Bartonella sp. W8122]|nr:DsbE family thiol:disulfide interchange protein [Bartonella sp. W8122]